MYRVLFKIGGFEIYSYAVLVLVGFLVALLIAVRLGARRGIRSDTMMDAAFYMLLAGILGARAAYVMLHWQQYQADPLQILNLRQGGLTIHGSLVLGTLATWAFCRIRKVSFGDLVDAMSPGLVVGAAIGRIGCYLNGCCYGVATTLPWGVVFPAVDALHRHPTQIYDMILDLGLAALLGWWFTRRAPSGEVFLVFWVGYSIVRFVIDFWRDEPMAWAGMTLAQLVSAGIGLVALALIFWRRAGRA